MEKLLVKMELKDSKRHIILEINFWKNLRKVEIATNLLMSAKILLLLNHLRIVSIMEVTGSLAHE